MMDMFLLLKIFFWTFSGLMVVAALFDLWRFIIPNWISVALAGLFLALAVLQPVPVAWLSHLGAMALVLLGSLVLYRFGFLGGGDLKLLSVAGLWIGLDSLLAFLVVTAIVGGGLSLALVAVRWMLTSVLVMQSAPDCFTRISLPRLLLPGEHVPYGVAIAAGGIWVARGLPHLGLFA